MNIEHRSVFIRLPNALARQLIEQGVAEPYIRRERADSSLLPQIVIAASSAATTVVVTKLTGNASKVLAREILNWRRKGSTVGSQVTITIRGAESEESIEMEITETISEGDITKALDSGLNP